MINKITTNEGSVLFYINDTLDITIPKGKFTCSLARGGVTVRPVGSGTTVVVLPEASINDTEYNTVEELASALANFSNGGGSGSGATVAWDNIENKPDVVASGNNEQEARESIGAGTSNYELPTGGTQTNVLRGNNTWSNIKTINGQSVLGTGDIIIPTIDTNNFVKFGNNVISGTPNRNISLVKDGSHLTMDVVSSTFTASTPSPASHSLSISATELFGTSNGGSDFYRLNPNSLSFQKGVYSFNLIGVAGSTAWLKVPNSGRYQDEKVMPVSVNGVYADKNGNIDISSIINTDNSLISTTTSQGVTIKEYRDRFEYTAKISFNTTIGVAPTNYATINTSVFLPTGVTISDSDEHYISIRNNNRGITVAVWDDTDRRIVLGLCNTWTEGSNTPVGSVFIKLINYK